MVREINIRGNVSQLINGDVHKVTGPMIFGTRDSNEAVESPKQITELQRKRINVLVKEWSAISGEKEVEIYKIFMNDFGIRYFRELPIEHYSTVKNTLEGWISADSAEVARVAIPAVEKSVQRVRAQHHLVCPACIEKDASFARAQKVVLTQRILIFTLTFFCGWLLYKMPVQI